jgi:hypothetical protein
MTPKAQREIARMETQAKFPYLLEVTYKTTGMNEPVTEYYANASEDVEFGGHIYTASFFSIDPPDKDGSKVGDATLTISAIDQTWIEKIRTLDGKATAKFVAAIVYDNENGGYDVENIEQYSFTLRGASWNEQSIQWTMVFDERMQIAVPCGEVTSQTFPGCA